MLSPASLLPSGRALGDSAGAGDRETSATAGTPTGGLNSSGWGEPARHGDPESSVWDVEQLVCRIQWFFQRAKWERGFSLSVFFPSPRCFLKSLKLCPVEIHVWADSHRKGLQSCSLWDAFLTFFGLSSVC